MSAQPVEPPPWQPSMLGRRARREGAAAAAANFGGVLTRAALGRLGFDDAAVRREIAAERWRSVGTHTVALHTGRLEVLAIWWRAIWEVAGGVALLDGVTALQAAGLTGFAEDVIHVSVPRNARCPALLGVRIHRVRRLGEEWTGRGVPRVRPEIAAIRAAHWARTDRQAALILAMTVQQRLTTGPRLVEAAEVARGRARRAFIAGVVADVADGAQALGEIDFARLCRRHGLPPPDRQVRVQTPAGRIYLDVRWAGAGLVVEIDGAGHRLGLAVSDDNLRANEVTLGLDRVLRIDVIGLRLREDDFMAQVRRGLSLGPSFRH